MAFAAISGHSVLAQAPQDSISGLQKKYVGTKESWQARAGFSEALSVSGVGRLLFLAGVGAEQEGKDGKILHSGDVKAQCRFAWQKIGRLLASEGASLRDIVKVTTYVTDASFRVDVSACRRDALGNAAPYPPHTFVVISALAEPEMLLEVDVTAALSQ